MKSYEAILAIGGHSNSLGDAHKVFEAVQANPSTVSELFSCVYSDDAWVRMRAIDTFEKLVRQTPDVAGPYVESLVGELANIKQPSIQWHLARLYAEVELSPSQRATAIEWLKKTIATIDVDWIVSVNVMKTLLYFHEAGHIRKDELMHLLRIQATHKSNAVQKKAQQFLNTVRLTQ